MKRVYLLLFGDLFKEVATRGVLHDEANILGSLHHVQELDDVWMLELPHDGDF